MSQVFRISDQLVGSIIIVFQIQYLVLNGKQNKNLLRVWEWARYHLLS